jgi:hypothetical protein
MSTMISSAGFESFARDMEAAPPSPVGCWVAGFCGCAVIGSAQLGVQGRHRAGGVGLVCLSSQLRSLMKERISGSSASSRSPVMRAWEAYCSLAAAERKGSSLFAICRETFASCNSARLRSTPISDALSRMRKISVLICPYRARESRSALDARCQSRARTVREGS